MPVRRATAPDPVGLLERAIGYTRTALGAVDQSLLGHPTPCSGWDLRTLLEHMDDALAAFTEAAEVGEVDLRHLARRPEAERLVESLRTRACAALGAWARIGGDEGVPVGAGRLDTGDLAAVGALEIAVHGWDVAQACRLVHPLPQGFAGELLDVAATVVTDADRPGRFGPARTSDPGTPGDRLLAFVGR